MSAGEIVANARSAKSLARIAERPGASKGVVVYHFGGKDELIPVAHTDKLYKSFTGKKMKIVMPHGSHNDLNSFPQYREFLQQDLPQFF